MVSGSKLIVYYSDQRDLNHGQKVVHQVLHETASPGGSVVRRRGDADVQRPSRHAERREAAQRQLRP